MDKHSLKGKYIGFLQEYLDFFCSKCDFDSSTPTSRNLQNFPGLLVSPVFRAVTLHPKAFRFKPSHHSVA